jgi:hypothetical protein
MLHVESKITIYDCHLFKKISRIGYCIPILSNMEFNMIQLIGITVTFTKCEKAKHQFILIHYVDSYSRRKMIG